MTKYNLNISCCSPIKNHKIKSEKNINDFLNKNISDFEGNLYMIKNASGQITI
jgi:hypothetical protein